MKKTRASTGLTTADRAAFDGPFLSYLHRRGLAAKSIERILWGVRHAGRWLARRRQCLVRLRPRHAPALLAASAAEHWGWPAQKDYKSCLACWFRFREPPTVARVERRRWMGLVESFVHFLEQHRGLAQTTRRAYRDIVTRYLEWQFAGRAPEWARVEAHDVWRYAESFRRGRRFSTLNHDLCRLRRFFSFLQMRGFPAAHLISAVPRYSNFGRSREPEILDDAQRLALLASFDRTTAVGARDYCIAVAMVEYSASGRAIEFSYRNREGRLWTEAEESEDYDALCREVKKGAAFDRAAIMWVKHSSRDAFDTHRKERAAELDRLVEENRAKMIELFGGRPVPDERKG